MTFTVVARCPKTKALGIALATSPLGVASRCPHVRGGVAAISSQCHSNWRLGLLGLDLAEQGKKPKDIMEAMRKSDPHFHDYRQVGIVNIEGELAVHSPPKGHYWTGHKTGDGFITMGNGIAGPQVVDEMFAAYQKNSAEPFEERILRTLEAGYLAGGEVVGQLSAGLIVADPGVKRPRIDLRIDMANPTPPEGGDAVKDLRRVFNAYKPLIPYYGGYWIDNPDLGWKDWLNKPAVDWKSWTNSAA